MNALAGVMDPELQRNVVELGMVRDVRIEAGRVTFTLALTIPGCPLKDQIVSAAKAAVLAVNGVSEVVVELGEMSAEERRRIGLGSAEPSSMAEHLNHIRHVVAVMSGKGGVGKSVVTALLATALRREGQAVGILDADITGPSIPKLFGLTERPQVGPIGMAPVTSSLGIKVMSVNLLLPEEDAAVVWRGPLISSAIRQFWGDVFWGDLDWLVVDLPPGTSDATLTVLQSLPVSGVLLVTTPQDLAGMVVRKGAHMAESLQVPMLGLVENMSYFVCPDSGRRYEVFGPSHGQEMAQQMGVPFLGQLPLDPRVSALCDAGKIEEYPIEAFGPIARRLLESAPEPHRSPVQPE